MEITKPSFDAVDTLVSLWQDLAANQRTFNSHLLVSENERIIRETFSQRIAMGRAYVARDTDIVGFVTFTTEVGHYEQDVTRGFIENLYVVPEYQNEGVGTALLDAAEGSLDEQGADVIALEALAENDEAQEFYQERGYQIQRLELEKDLRE